MDYCDAESFPLSVNGDHSVVFEIASRFAFQTLLLTMMATPSSSEGFLPTVVDIMVI